MTTTFTVDKSFAYIDRLTKHGAVFAACAGMHNRVILATRGADTVNITGVSDQLTAQPLDVVSDGTPSAYYVLTPKGLTTLSAVTNPVITAESVFDTGANRWLFYSGGNLITPTAQGGVRLQTVGGTVLATLSGILCESTTAAFANGVLYVFCAKTGKMAVVTVTAAALVFEGLFDAPNCREILRAVIDGTDLYCLNRNRVVRFSIATATSPTLAQDYGKSAVEFTDMAVVAVGKLWFGFLTSTPGVTGPEFFGPLYGVWDSASQEIQTAAPRMSAWMVNNVIPYYTSTTIPTIIPAPPPAPVVPPAVVPPVVAPLPPVITSSLTASVTEDTTFAYTITATGAGPITYSVLSPPSWLTSVNALTGAISGIPSDPGTFNVTIRATNAGGSDTETLVVTVTAAIGDNTGVYTNNTVTTVELDSTGLLAYCAGTFTSVTDASGTYTRNRLACLNLTTGRWTAWDPNSNATMYFAVPNTDGYIYVGGNSAVMTLGGTARAYVGRVNSTTGAIDATWTPTFSNTARSACCIGTTVYFVGSLQTVNGNSRPLGCSFTGGILNSWKLQNALGHTMRSLTNIAGNGTLACVRAYGASIFACGNDSSLYLDETNTILGHRCQGYLIADGASGVVPQMSRGVSNANSFSSSSPNAAVVVGGSIYASAVTGPQSFTERPLPLAPADPNVWVAQITGSGDVSASFAPVPAGSPSSAGHDGVGGVLVGGAIPSFEGDTSLKSLAKYSSGGVLDTSFTFTSRGNAAFIASAPTVYDNRYTAGAVVVAGTFGGSTQTYGGTRVENILVLNALTGARL